MVKLETMIAQEPFSSSLETNLTLKDKTLSGLGSLVKLLPTGTVFMFQFFNPVITNSGHCTTINKIFSGILIGACGLSCFFSTFTDSYPDNEGKLHYGIATLKGLYPSSDSTNLSAFKLKLRDFVHAFLVLLLFSVVSLLDTNTVNCFYPAFQSEGNNLVTVVPTVIGAFASAVFFVFPNTRHGIGYPTSSSSNPSPSLQPSEKS